MARSRKVHGLTLFIGDTIYRSRRIVARPKHGSGDAHYAAPSWCGPNVYSQGHELRPFLWHSGHGQRATDLPDPDLIYGTAAMTMIGIATLLLLLLLVSSARTV
jgi:hypothetical protein